MTPIEKEKYVDLCYQQLLDCKPMFRLPENLAIIDKAYTFAKHAHAGINRLGGEQLPYIVHPIAVASIVAKEMGFGLTMVQAALLHDTVEDCPDITVETIRQSFGPDVSFLVENVTKITYKSDNKYPEQVETFRQLLQAMTRDRRVAYLKLADRLDNLRTMDDMKDSMKMVKTAESIDLYAPLAHLLGLFKIKAEIENLSFEYRENEEFKKTKYNTDKYIKNQEERINFEINTLKELASKNFPNIKIERVQKSYYKIWRVLQKPNMTLNSIHNLYTYRLVIPEPEFINRKRLCFDLYSDITDNFTRKVRALRDWISEPKSNGFSAVVFDANLNERWVELQILTEKMNQIAQSGFADDYDNSHQFNIDIWVKDTVEELEINELSSEEVMDLLRPYEREIIVFTPQGQIIKLPKGATALDFAFKIHSEIGLGFQSAEVNGVLVPANFRLRDTDSVVINSSKEVEPDKEWLNVLFMKRHKNKLIRYFSEKENLVVENGKNIYNSLNLNIDDRTFNKILSETGCKNERCLYYKIGSSALSTIEIIKMISSGRSIFEIIKELLSKQVKTFEQNLKDIKFDPKKPFVIYDTDARIKTAPCCRPVHGDTAIVYKEDENSFIVHKRDCETARLLNATEKSKTTTVEWSDYFFGEFNTIIELEGHDRPNLVLDVVRIISSEMNLNMTELNIKSRGRLFIGKIHLLVHNVNNLKNVINLIKNVPDIRKVYRAI